MKRVIVGCLAVAALAVPSFVQAQDTASGTLTVTGTVESSISLTIESAGGTFSGGGTNAATTSLGSISKFGAVPTNFTRTSTATTWTLASNIGVTVLKSNSTSASYTLNAKLSTAPATGVVWSVNELALNASTVTAMTATGAWGSTPTYAWTIEIPDALADASAVDNVIEFSAIAG